MHSFIFLLKWWLMQTATINNVNLQILYSWQATLLSSLGHIWWWLLYVGPGSKRIPQIAFLIQSAEFDCSQWSLFCCKKSQSKFIIGWMARFHPWMGWNDQCKLSHLNQPHKSTSETNRWTRIRPLSLKSKQKNMPVHHFQLVFWVWSSIRSRNINHTQYQRHDNLRQIFWEQLKNIYHLSNNACLPIPSTLR